MNIPELILVILFTVIFTIWAMRIVEAYKADRAIQRNKEKLRHLEEQQLLAKLIVEELRKND